MEQQSLYDSAKALDTTVRRILALIDKDGLPFAEKSTIEQLQRLLTDAKLDVRDYEFADTRAEQLQLAGVAREHLEQVEKSILKASEYNIFSAVDVAAISASLQHIIARLG